MQPDKPFEPITLLVIGCGQRGNVRISSSEVFLNLSCSACQAYGKYALKSDACKVVAIAEPRPRTRQLYAEKHCVDKTLVFDTWMDLHAASSDTIKTVGKRLADAVVPSLPLMYKFSNRLQR